jgi:hypothetical protein
MARTRPALHAETKVGADPTILRTRQDQGLPLLSELRAHSRQGYLGTRTRAERRAGAGPGSDNN